jgi:hypothetical protein
MTEIQPGIADPATPAEPPQQVPFDGGCLGCVFVLSISVGALMAIAAFDSAFVASMAADDQVRRNIFAAIAPLRIGGINLGALFLAMVSGWEAVKLARRFIDRNAVWLDGDMIRFHPTVRRRPLALLALERITHEAGDIKSILVLEHSGGARITIKAVEHDAAAAFVAEAEQAKAALIFA